MVNEVRGFSVLKFLAAALPLLRPRLYPRNEARMVLHIYSPCSRSRQRIGRTEDTMFPQEGLDAANGRQPSHTATMKNRERPPHPSPSSRYRPFTALRCPSGLRVYRVCCLHYPGIRCALQPMVAAAHGLHGACMRQRFFRREADWRYWRRKSSPAKRRRVSFLSAKIEHTFFTLFSLL